MTREFVNHRGNYGRIINLSTDAAQMVIPLGKLIQPQDISETILFLPSKQAQMITGQVIKVSRGHAL